MGNTAFKGLSCERAINEKRLEQKQQEVLHLKTGIQILCKAVA